NALIEGMLLKISVTSIPNTNRTTISPMIISVRLNTLSVRIWRKERRTLFFAFTIASGVLEGITRRGRSLRVITPFSTDVSIKIRCYSIISVTHLLQYRLPIIGRRLQDGIPYADSRGGKGRIIQRTAVLLAVMDHPGQELQ